MKYIRIGHIVFKSDTVLRMHLYKNTLNVLSSIINANVQTGPTISIDFGSESEAEEAMEKALKDLNECS